MNIQLSKLSALCQAVSVLTFGALLTSCQLPKQKDDRYSVAEWSVNSTVAKEDYPVGVSLEKIDDASLPIPEELASGQASTDSIDFAPASEPALSSLGSEHPVSDELLNTNSQLELPPPAPVFAATEKEAPAPAAAVEIRPAVTEEIRPAKISQSPENLALMAASTTRPPSYSRGVNGRPMFNIAQAYAAPTEQVASIAPAPVTPPTDDLAEILKLARQLEASRR